MKTHEGEETMRALTVPRYGGPEVLRVTEIPRPQPAPNEVLVRVAWGAINAADRRLMRADPWMVRLAFGLKRPRFRALGMALSGTVVESASDQFAVGDRVAADLSGSGCNAFADYVAISVNDLVAVPPGLDLDQAATLPLAGTTALQALRDHARVERGSRVLVTGASGAVGSLAVQLARDLGAEVWAITSAPYVELVTAFGAAHVTERNEDLPHSSFDAVIDTAGYRNIFDYEAILAPRGTYVHIGGSMVRLLQTATVGALRSRRGGRQWKTLNARAHADDLAVLVSRAAEGAIRAPIGARVPLADAAEAMRFMESHTVPGRVLINMA